MKKPFLCLKTKKDVLKLLVCILLCASATLLFFLPEKSVAVFAGEGNTEIKSLFGFINSLV